MSEAKMVVKPVKPPITEAEKLKRLHEKVANFKKMANKRTAKAMGAIRLLGNLASPNYSYTPEQVDRIISALQTEIDTVYEAFKAKKVKGKLTFDL